MRAVLDFDRWPVWLLLPVAIVCIGVNCPPLAPLSLWHVLVVALATLGFGSALLRRLPRRQSTS